MKKKILNKNISVLIVIVSLFYVNSVYSQDIHFTQFNQAPLLINPALAGNFKGGQRVFLHYKNQWQSIGVPYKSYSFSLDAQLMKKRKADRKAYLGVGLYLYSDKSGEVSISTTQANIALSAHVPLNRKNFFSAGIQGGFAQKSLKNGNQQWGSQFNGFNYDSNIPGENIAFTSNGFGDFTTGVTWTYQDHAPTTNSNDNTWLKTGVSYSHFTKPQVVLYSVKDQLNTKFLAHAQGQIGLKNTKIAIRPSLLWMKQEKQQEIDASLLFRYMLNNTQKFNGAIQETAISLGVYYRVGDAIAPVVFMEFSNIGIGVSYDINLSKLKAATSGMGGLEVVLRYIHTSINHKKPNVKFK